MFCSWLLLGQERSEQASEPAGHSLPPGRLWSAHSTVTAEGRTISHRPEAKSGREMCASCEPQHSSRGLSGRLSGSNWCWPLQEQARWKHCGCVSQAEERGECRARCCGARARGSAAASSGALQTKPIWRHLRWELVLGPAPACQVRRKHKPSAGSTVSVFSVTMRFWNHFR